MNKKAIILIIVLAIIAVIYFIFIRYPKISIESIDKIKKTAKIKIGNKTTNFNNSLKLNTKIPGIKFIYSASIEHIRPNLAKVKLYRLGKFVTERNINF